MPYTLIKGSFHIHYPDKPRNGPEPDGDTIKFQPDHRQLIENLPKSNKPPTFNQAGMTNIRFEGIDALETHFQIEGDSFHQNMGLALAARDALLAQIGFGEVTFFDDAPFKVKTVEHHPIRGYVLSNGLDTYGRTIAFVFTGEHSAVDGSSIFVTPEMLDSSLNAFMLTHGQAYGAFYLSLPAELREHLKTIVTTARTAGIGLWAEATATTTRSATIAGLDELQTLVLWPKLFRRLAAFYQDGQTDLAGLDTWLRADPRDRDDRLLLPNNELGNMHDLIAVNGHNVRLSYLPEDVVIVPDDFALPETPVAPSAPLHVGAGSIRIMAALVNPKGQDRGNETVTLLNTTDADIDLTHWLIADQTGKQALTGVLASGETVRVALTGSVQLSNTRDTITILDPQGVLIDQVSYEARLLPNEGHTMVF